MNYLSPTFSAACSLRSAARYIEDTLEDTKDNLYNRVKAQRIMEALAEMIEGQVMLESLLSDLGFPSCSI